jgi:hypothetical protein
LPAENLANITKNAPSPTPTIAIAVEKSTMEGKFDAPDSVCIWPRSLKVFKKNRYPWVNLTGSVPPGYKSIATVVNATNSAQTPATIPKTFR